MAATGAEIARAYVTVLTQMPGVKRDVTKALGGVDLGPTGQSMGSKLAGGITKSLKLGVKAVGATIAVGVGTALVKGFQRLDAIDTAKAKLTGLGNDTKTVSTIMKNALTSVKGTAFGLGDAATVSAAAVAAGIKPGEALTKHLKSIANNASAAGVSMGEMGSIFNKAATQANGVQNDVISQLADKGIPIYQELGKVMGVTAGEVFKLASEGKVSFEQFSQAATAAAGTVADEMGKTTKGAWANFVASLGRVGAGLLSGVFTQIAPVLQATTKAFGPLEDVAGKLGEKIGKIVAPAVDKFIGFLNKPVNTKPFTDLWQSLSPLSLVFKTLQPVLPALGSALSTVAGILGGALAQALPQVVPPLTDFLLVGAQIVTAVLPAFANLLTGVASGASAAVGVLAPWSDVIIAVGLGVGAAVIAFKAWYGAIAVWTGITKAAAVVQKAFNFVMNANPILKIISIVLAVVAALGYFFTQTKLGKEIWANFTRFLGEAWRNISAFFKQVWENVLKPVFEGIGQVLSFVWNSILKPIFDAIVTAARWTFETILQPIFNAVQVAFAIMAGIFQGVWEGILRPIFEAIGAIFQWLWDTIISVIVGYIKAQIQVWGAIFTWLWETILQPVFAKIGEIFNWIYTYVIQPIILGIQVYIKMWGAIFTWLWNTILKPVFDAIGRIFTWILNTIIKPIVDGIQKQIRVTGAVFTWLYQNAIKPAWDAISNVISSVWTKGIKPVIDTLVKVITSDPKKAFEAARDAIGKAWKGIQDLAKAPVRFVVQTVIGGLIDVVNGFGLNLKKPQLPKGFATGGILPGSSRMHHGDDQIIQARRGEGVMVSEALRTKADRSAFLSVNAAGRRGVGFASMMQGLARGGLVSPLPKGSYSVSQPFKGAAHNGIDLAAPMGTRILAALSGIAQLVGPVNMGGNEIYVAGSNGIGTRYSHLSRFAVKEGQRVRQGQTIGYVGATGMATGPHLHYMVQPGGDAARGRAYNGYVDPAPYLGVFGKELGVGAGLFDGFIDGAVGQIKKAFPAGGWAIDLAGGLAKTTLKGLTSFFTGKLGADTGTTGAKLYDRGGVIPHGGTGVNLSGKPEAVLTNTEMNGYKLLMRALSGAGGLGGVGGNALAGLVSGLRGGRGGVVAAVQEIASVIVSTANKVLDIHSPSRKLQTVGKYTGAGLVAGITGSVPATRAATERLVGAVLSAFDQLGSERSSLQTRLDKALGNWRGAKAGSRAKANYAAQIADYRKQIAAINASIGAPGKSKQPALMTFLSTQNAKLNSLALQRAAVAKRLAAAQKVLAESADTMADWSSGIQDKINSLGGITEKSSVASMVANLQKRITATQGFTATIEKLRKMGLDTGSIQELTEQFAQSGSSKAADALLASGASGVKQVVDLRKQLNAAGGKLGDQVGNVLYQAGIDSARGLVKGLQSQEKALQAQAKRIADTITATVRKTLGIKSPSRVLMKDGRWSGLGFARGIDSSLGEVAASARAMVQMPAALTPEVSLSRSSLPPREIRMDDLAQARTAGTAGYSGPVVLQVGEREFDGYMGEIADDRISRLRKVTNRARQRANGTR
ncbi:MULTISPECIES: peptidoglycan DD-metalloendopeptidase family protein [unclassified Leucobacter]|uniref:peptidoglycan DD-metalloendopeptidase family protein n=1 Tax=unclassified Leucobacter TaxID=2621730 RepID=UPI00069C5360|nr:peptidoglycan DD-metalloendopeptidase family protein [Leucobacter sp. Ag1]